MAHLCKESPRFYALTVRVADWTMCVRHTRIYGSHLQLPSLGFARLLLVISKHPSQYLTTGTLWNDLDELNAALEPFVFRLVLFHVKMNRLHGFVIGLLSRFERFDDKGFGEFASTWVWDLDDCTVGNKRVGEEVRFQLGGSDLVTLVLC